MELVVQEYEGHVDDLFARSPLAPRLQKHIPPGWTLLLRSALREVGANAFGELADRVHVARAHLPVEEEVVVLPPGDDVEVKVEHGLAGGRTVRLREADARGVEGPAHRIRDPAAGERDGRERRVVRLEEVRRVGLRDDEAVAFVRRD